MSLTSRHRSADELDLRTDAEIQREQEATETIGAHMRRTGQTDALPGETVAEYGRRTGHWAL